MACSMSTTRYTPPRGARSSRGAEAQRGGFPRHPPPIDITGVRSHPQQCFAEKDRKTTIDPELVYFHLKQQGRIVDRSRPKVDNSKVVRVDMSSGAGSRLPGFEEWVRDYWTEEGHDASMRIQRRVRGNVARRRVRETALEAMQVFGRAGIAGERRTMEGVESAITDQLFNRDERSFAEPSKKMGALEV